jgi:hypothetical protein
LKRCLVVLKGTLRSGDLPRLKRRLDCGRLCRASASDLGTDIGIDMDFNRINGEKLIVGSHPQNAADIDNLYDNNAVRAIVNLQRSGEPLRGDIDAITARCAQLGNRIWYQREPIRDGDAEDGPESVRARLPWAVGILNKAITEKAQNDTETVYLHCCEGRGRSPSVAVAYFYWFTARTLDQAMELVTNARRCHPFQVSIREATNYILQQCGRNAVNGNISATDRQSIIRYVTTLPAVRNA